MTFVRLYRGSLCAGDSVLNANTGKRERISRLYQMHADQAQAIEVANAGDIVGLAGLKDTMTGHTLCAPDNVILLEQIEVAEPVIDLAIEAKNQAEQQTLAKALASVLREDPSLRLTQIQESGQMILSGMGELQLDVTLEKIRANFGVDVQVGQPQVAYRETVTRTARLHHVHKKQTGGPGQFAELELQVEALPRGAGLTFVSDITGGAIPREFIPAIEAGVRSAAQAGVLAGYPLLDLQVTLLDGSFHERDSSAMAFELAASNALRTLAREAGLALLEPMMAVEVMTPAEYIGDCIGDLNRRRGMVRGQETVGNSVQISALVPLAQMFGYIGNLRALSSGRAQFTMQFEHYQIAPPQVAVNVIKQ